MQPALADPASEPRADCGIILMPVEYRLSALQAENEALKQQVRDLMARNRLLEQLAIALGDVNRYYASQTLGWCANENEAFDHFVFNGGKKHYDEAHR
ncbi:MAG TPA: hypothetical protein VFT82_03125 [Candidatus Paceibacterota bacterium]|nr:hypothetical protein [Candidatus Paceibacterota bacterium]